MRGMRCFLFIVFFWSIATVIADAQAQTWQQVPIRTLAMKDAEQNGEGFQLIWDIKYSPSNPNTAYIIVDTSQVWKSTDGGSSWQRKAKGFYANGGASLGVSPSNANIVFAAGGQMGTWGQLTPNRDGIYRTLDGGESWTLVRPNLHFNRQQVGDLFVFPSTNVVYAGTFDSGILKSTDNGSTWSTIVSFATTASVHDIKLHPSNNTIIFVSSDNGYKKIEDKAGVVTISNLGSGLTKPFVSVINKNDPNIIHAITGNSIIYRSTNGGISFSSIFSNSNTSKKARRMAMSPVDSNYIFVSYGEKSYGTNEEFYFTQDGGNNWRVPQSMDVKNEYGWVSGSLLGWNFDSGGAFMLAPIAPHPTNRSIALTMGAPDHVTKTVDGGLNWRRSNSGYTGGGAGLGYSRFSWDKSNANRFAIGLTDMGGFLTEDGGDTFRNFRADYNGQSACHGVSLDPAAGSKVIVGACGHNYNGQAIQVSRDNGVKWTVITNPNTVGLYKFISFSPTNGNVIYASRYSNPPDTSGKLDYIPDTFISTDKGYTWSRITRNGASVHVVAVFPKNGDIIYATSGGMIYKSSDRGKTWTAPYPQLDVSNEGISQLAVDPNDENSLYAAVPGRGLYIVTLAEKKLRNENNGITLSWLGFHKTNWVAVDPRDGNNIYIASYTSAYGHTNEAIFRSTDRGMSWQNITYNLSPISIASVAVNPHNSNIYIGSAHGTWKLPPPGIVSIPPAAPSGLRIMP